jgi:MFS family permease
VIRTRLTWLVYVQLSLYAYFLYGFGPSVNLLRADLGVSRALGGLHGTALAAGAVLAGLSGRWAVARFGRGRLLWLGIGGLCAGVVGYCAATVLPLTLLAALVCGTCGSWVVNTANAALMEAHGARGPGALSEANALAALVGTAAPLVLGACVGIGAGWRAGLLVTLVLAGAAGYVFRGVRLPAPHPIDPADHPGGAHSLPPVYWITWGVLVCTIGVEFCLSLWASDLLGSRDRLSPGAATAVWSGLLLGVAISRFVGGRLTAHHSVDSVLLGALVIDRLRDLLADHVSVAGGGRADRGRHRSGGAVPADHQPRDQGRRRAQRPGVRPGVTRRRCRRRRWPVPAGRARRPLRHPHGVPDGARPDPPGPDGSDRQQGEPSRRRGRLSVPGRPRRWRPRRAMQAPRPRGGSAGGARHPRPR